jgi:hypothetical protein
MEKGKPKRLPPVKIPLPFERAVEGLLAVDPKGQVREKSAKKKPRPKSDGADHFGDSLARSSPDIEIDWRCAIDQSHIPATLGAVNSHDHNRVARRKVDFAGGHDSVSAHFCERPPLPLCLQLEANFGGII